VPREIRQLASLERLNLRCNKLTSVPAEIGGLTLLRMLDLTNNKLTTVQIAVGALQANSCDVELNDDVTIDTGDDDEWETDDDVAINSVIIVDNGDDIDVLRLWRDREPGLQRLWQGDNPKDWDGVTFDGDRVVKLGQVGNQLTIFLAEIGGLTLLADNQLTRVPAEIGQFTSDELDSHHSY